MAVDSPAEVMLMKLLVKHKQITQDQLDRVIDKVVGSSEKTLPEEILERKFVDKKNLNKILDLITKRGIIFPRLNEDIATRHESAG